MSLLNRAKEVVKEQKKNQTKKLSPMEELLADNEVKTVARYLAKHMSMSRAREALNAVLEEEGRLPKTASGKTVKITYKRFKSLLPRSRKNATD